MPVRSIFSHISVGAMMSLTVASTSLAQRIEPLAASSRSLTMEGTSNQPTKNGEYQVAIESANMWRGAAGGVLGVGAGLVGGLLAGALWGGNDGCRGEDCEMRGAITGAVVGEAVGLALGTHYGARGRGKLAVGMLTSTAIAVAGLYGIASAERAAPVILAVVPVLQLTALLAMER